MNFSPEKKDHLIETLYKIVDENHDYQLEEHELIQYLNTWSHTKVTEQNLKEVLALICLEDNDVWDQEDFNIFMKSPIVWPFDTDEMLKLFLVFDPDRKGKVYWKGFKHYVKKFAIELYDTDMFLQYFGTEYLSDGGWLDYASFWYNNFGYEVSHEGELQKSEQHSYVQIDHKPSAKSSKRSILPIVEEVRKPVPEKPKRESQKEEMKRLEEEELRELDEMRKLQQEEEDRENERRRKRDEDAANKAREEADKEARRKKKQEEDRKKKEDEQRRRQEEEDRKRQEEEDRKQKELDNMDPLARYRKILYESTYWSILQKYEINCSANNISWFGHYIDNLKKVELIIENMQIGFDGLINGQGSDIVGDYIIKGEMNVFESDKKALFVFEKTYQSASMSLKFTGSISNNMLVGTYTYGSMKSGNFELRMGGHEWTGWRVNTNNKKRDYDLNFIMNNNYVFGIGLNETGGYLVKGSFEHEIDGINFIVAYFDQNRQMHLGKTSRVDMNKRKCDVTIDGSWNSLIDTENQRDFEIKGFYGDFKDNEVESTGEITPEPEQMHTPSAESENEPIDNDEPNINNLGKKLEEKMIQWSGTKTYSTNPNMPIKFYFEDFQIHSDLTIGGLGSDLLGDYDITGKVKVDNKGQAIVTFSRRYVDDEEATLTSSMVGEKQSNQIEDTTSVIKYTGKMLDLSKVEGEWEITAGKGKGFKGSFEMKSSGQDWKGKWTVGGKEKELIMHLIIDEDFAYAASNDSKSNGFYLIRGDNDSEAQKIIFVQKFYNGNVNILFEGTAKKIKPGKAKSRVKVEGTYINQNTGETDKFYMIGEYGQLVKGIDTAAESPTKKRKARIVEAKSRNSPVKKPPANKPKSIPWVGRYEQFNQWHDMHFSHMQFDHHGDLWGNGDDSVGKFDIKGKINNKLEIKFDKQYIGAHCVTYQGQMDAKHNIHGDWIIQGNTCGKFELMKNIKHGLFKDILPDFIEHIGSV